MESEKGEEKWRHRGIKQGEGTEIDGEEGANTHLSTS